MQGGVFIVIRRVSWSRKCFWSCTLETHCSELCEVPDPSCQQSATLVVASNHSEWIHQWRWGNEVKSSLVRLLWGFRGLIFIKHLYLPMKHTVLAFLVMGPFSQVKKEGVAGVGEAASEKLSECFPSPFSCPRPADSPRPGDTWADDPLLGSL